MASAGSENKVAALQRKRVQQMFDHVSKMITQEGYDFSYATDLLFKCVVGDLEDARHLQVFLANLHRKYDNNRKGVSLAFLKSMGPRGAMKKALAKKDWEAAIKAALEVLKNNPWDSGALCGLATVAENLGYDDCELKCLKAALDANGHDVAVNRQCAQALARRGQYDQAIACWHRVEKARPNDEEPPKEIGRLTLLKTMAKSAPAEEPRKPQPGPAKAAAQAAPVDSREEQLKKAAAAAPTDHQPQMQLGEFYFSADRFKESVAAYTKALELAPNNDDVREKLGDAELSYLKQLLTAAEQKMKSGGGDEAKQEHRKLRKRQLLKETEVYTFRCQRYPNNTRFKYDLGLRLQAQGEYTDAIKQFQAARGEPRLKGLCLLALGQCFLGIKQLRLAMTHFAQAVDEIPERDQESKKRALYEAGKTAMGLRDKKAARGYLSNLAQLDFNYKDVSGLLDKVEKMSDDDGPAAANDASAEAAP